MVIFSNMENDVEVNEEVISHDGCHHFLEDEPTLRYERGIGGLGALTVDGKCVIRLDEPDALAVIAAVKGEDQ